MIFPTLIRPGVVPVLLGLLSLAAPTSVTGATEAPAVGRFLVASASMRDPRFRHSVIVLVRYGSGGALGLAVNRPGSVTVAEAFPQVEEMQGLTSRLWLGGPVDPERPAVLVETRESPPGALPVLGRIHFSHAESVIRSVAADSGARFRIYAGYAGWAPGQLDAEIAHGAWVVVAAGAEEVFSDDQESLWSRLHRLAAGTWVRRSVPGAVEPCSDIPTIARAPLQRSLSCMTPSGARGGSPVLAVGGTLADVAGRCLASSDGTRCRSIGGRSPDRGSPRTKGG